MSEIESLLKSGQTALNLGNPKDALAFYEKVLEQDPTNLQALFKKGNIFGNLENMKMPSFVMMVFSHKKKKTSCHY